MQTKACCQNMSHAVEGKFMEDVRKQLAILETTVQDQQAKLEDQQAKITDQQAKIEALNKKVNSLKKDGKN